MTALDMIKLGIVQSHEEAEDLAEKLVEKWHENLIPGELYDVLGLTPREYQAWTTGHVSLLTIAQWHKTSHPPLDHHRPWFRVSGDPGSEVIGYLENVPKNAKNGEPVEPTRKSPKRAVPRR